MTRGLETYLGMLFGAEPTSALVEVRYRRDRGGMGQAWHGVREVEQAARAIRKLGATTDCYVGVLPRAERRGCRDAIRQGHVLYVDSDAAEPMERLADFCPPPSMVISSGTGRHAYWALAEPLAPDWIERANRRLAHALGADMRATDAARILRPPETFNFKTGSPVAVTAESINVEVYAPAEVVGELPDPPERRAEPRKVHREPGVPNDDPLHGIPPVEYVEALTGERVGRDGKLCCPLPGHDDRTPSFQAYDDPAQGWYCFGCDRGGDIYSLAAALWALGTVGDDFLILRRRIAERLLNTAVAA